jgi:hypothetical protein
MTINDCDYDFTLLDILLDTVYIYIYYVYINIHCNDILYNIIE